MANLFCLSNDMKRKQILGLVTMLASSVIIAFIVVVILVYAFGQPGTYRLNQVLVSPNAMEEVSVTNFDPKTGKGSRFIFNKIEFVAADKSGKGWGRYPISVKTYTDFYRLIRGVRSVTQVSDKIVDAFNVSTPSTLTVFVQPKKGKKEAIFQQVDFLDEGDLFRVSVPEGEWVYFRLPGIYQEVIKLFVPDHEKQQDNVSIFGFWSLDGDPLNRL